MTPEEREEIKKYNENLTNGIGCFVWVGMISIWTGLAYGVHCLIVDYNQPKLWWIVYGFALGLFLWVIAWLAAYQLKKDK